MITLKEIDKVYLVGIGGIGMSALARYFQTQGKEVSGYDKTATPLTRELEASGMKVHYEENIDDIPKDVQLVIFTPAVPKDHKELQYYQQNGYEVMKRSEVLGLISNSSFNICIGGTHGKTTMTTMTAHVLRHSGYGCNAFLGGIAANYNTNFWSNERNVCVIEADEYDRSFLRLFPDVAVIGAMDADHLDIYGTEEALEQAFIDFTKKIKPGGFLLSKYGLKRGNELQATHHLTYSQSDSNADVFASDIKMEDGSYRFTVNIKGKKISDVVLNMGGMHNVENSLAAVAIADHLGIESEKIKAAIADFKGVKRRFEYIVKKKDIVFIDDYAHHPEELRALIGGAKGLFSDRKCIVLFQPHLYSRTNDFAAAFAQSLDMADEVVLLPIYPARELPMPGVESEMVLNKMSLKEKRVMQKQEMLNYVRDHVVSLSKNKPVLLIASGAGDIDALIQPIKEIISS